MPAPPFPLRQLRRVRWAVRCTLVLGVAASVAANVLHAQPDPVAQIIAAWPPLALLLTVELISRVPVHRRSLAAARLVATTAIAGIAAWVSYWHMAGVAARYGEQGASPFLLPLSVDGLVIVASVSLVELAGRIRVAESARTSVPADAAAAARRGEQSTVAVSAAVEGTAGRHDGARAAMSTVHAGPDHAASPAAAEPTVDAVAHVATPPTLDTEPSDDAPSAAAAQPADTAGRGDDSGRRGENRFAGRTEGPARAEVPITPTAPSVPTARTGNRPPDDPRAAIAYWHAQDPTLRPGEIAAKVGRSRSTVRRILAELAGADATDSYTTGPDPAPADTGAAGGGAAGAGVNGKATPLAGSYVSD